MPCKSVLATRVEASLVLAAFNDDSEEHAAGLQMYAQLFRSFEQKNPLKTIAAANAHVLSKSRTSVRSIACALDDERRAAYDSGDRTGIEPTRWAGLPMSMRPYYFQGTLHQIDRDIFRRSVEGQNESKALRMASGKFVISSAHGLVSAFTKNGLRILCAPPSVKNTAAACVTLSFALSTRCNELLGWAGHVGFFDRWMGLSFLSGIPLRRSQRSSSPDVSQDLHPRAAYHQTVAEPRV